MAIKKIIYVTEGRRDDIPDIDPNAVWRWWELSKASRWQLENVLKEVLIPEIGDVQVMFKSSGYTNPSWETLWYLKFLLKKPDKPYNIESDSFSKSEAREIDNISKPKLDEEIVIFGAMHEDFKKLIDSLKNNWYNVIDKEAVKDRWNIYTLTVHLDDSKKTDFHEFGEKSE